MKTTNMKIPSVEEANNLLQKMDEFHYQMLSRLRGDCFYFLTMGGRLEKHLWAKSVDGQIEQMWQEYNQCRIKPVWCTAEDIIRFKFAMCSKDNGYTLLTSETKAFVWDNMDNPKYIKDDDAAGIEPYGWLNWWLEKIVPEGGNDNAFYILWIGDDLAETFSIDFGKEIIEYQEQYEKQYIRR